MKLLLTLLLCLGLAGCLSYDEGRYMTLAAAGSLATEITPEVCAAHDAAAAALRAGPNRAVALPLVGGGATLADVAREHDIAAAVCREAMTRGLQDQRLLDAWRRVWEAGMQEVE